MKRILFVDDEQLVLDGLRRMLRPMRREWEMFFVDSGEEALQFLDQTACDVIVSDMRMPGMSGLELLDRVREKHPETIRLALSGHADAEMLLESVKATHQFLSKPCDAETLRVTIDRALGLRGLLQHENIGFLISRIQSLPSLPSLYEEIVREINDSKGSIHRIGEIISRDLGMTSKILQLVNSSFFGLARHVSSPAQAAGLLGLNTIRSLVLTTKVFSQFDLKDSGLNPENLWRHSSLTGSLSRKIAAAEQLDRKSQDEALMAGMLHDVGKLVLANGLPGEFREVMKRADETENPHWLVEQDVFGCTHAEVGAYLMGIWGLPNTIVEALAYHHYPSHGAVRGFSSLSAVHVANELIKHPQASEEELCEHLDMDYLQRLGCGNKLGEWIEMSRNLLDGGEPEDG
ncbi:HDOD domain-containing protein [Thiolapillus sp.]